MIFSQKLIPQWKCILKKQINQVSQDYCSPVTVPKIHDTVFVRHAHSEFNGACEDYRIKHKIDYDWDALRNHKGFDEAVAYNPLYIDCPLTKKGV